MLEIERKLGRHLAGRTTKAASLLRIADYLVSRNIIEAVPEQENGIVTSRPMIGGRLRSVLAAAAVLLLLMAGAALYHRQVKTGKELLLQTVVPAGRSTATALVTQPLVTTAVTPTAAPPPPQDAPGSSQSLTHPGPMPSPPSPR
jgi:hypothetical protein